MLTVNRDILRRGVPRDLLVPAGTVFPLVGYWASEGRRWYIGEWRGPARSGPDLPGWFGGISFHEDECDLVCPD